MAVPPLTFTLAADLAHGLRFEARGTRAQFSVEKITNRWMAAAEFPEHDERELCESYGAAVDWCNAQNHAEDNRVAPTDLLTWASKYDSFELRFYTEAWAAAPDKAGVYQVFQDNYAADGLWQALYVPRQTPEQPCVLKAQATQRAAQKICEAHARERQQT